ncbi:MAG: hypothetical protein JSR54_19045, partial [Proteobacteria bacterium]|nr:hypothetical protein [Pseudomonadota bacterium]
MFGAWPGRRDSTPAPARVVLELSGPRLDQALGKLVSGCEAHGGIERYVEALKLKSTLFQDVLGATGGRAHELEPTEFKALCAFMATVRRRIAPLLERPAFDVLPGAISRLVAAIADPRQTDARVASFVAEVGRGGDDRWVRDLAAELLHNL